MEIKNIKSSYSVASDSVQNPAQYIDVKETSDTQTQTSGQVADYATLHPSTRFWEVSKDHVKMGEIVGKGTSGQEIARNPRGRPGKQ